MTEYRCLRYKDGWWYGVVYTSDPATGAETTVYQTEPAMRRQDAVNALYCWLAAHRGIAYNPTTGDSK